MRAWRLVVFLGLAACGSDGGAAPPDAGPPLEADARFGPTAEEYCEQIAPFFCDFYMRCGRVEAPDCIGFFLETCNSRYEPRYVDLERAGLLHLSLPGLEECRAWLGGVPCEQQPFELSGPCARMWEGRSGVGEACGLDVESFVCDGETTCVVGLDLCGTCQVAAPIGSPCSASGSHCQPEAFCDGELCQARAMPGQPCNPNLPCLVGIACGVSGICEPPIYAPPGGSCASGQRCVYGTLCVGGSCVPGSGLGAPCGAQTPCLSGLCQGGVCQPFLADGDVCTQSFSCASGYCDSTDHCHPLPGPCF